MALVLTSRGAPIVVASEDRVGRVQRVVRRSFVALGRPLTIADVLPRAFPRATSYTQDMRKSVWRAFPKFAVCLGRIPTRQGRPCLWAPNSELQHLISGHRSR